MRLLSGWSAEIHVVVLPTVNAFLGIDRARLPHRLLRQHIVKS
jgi:hypothetical protein